MRHLKAGRKLGMNGSHRRAVLRNMVDSLIREGRIKTTVTRAKELRKLADKMVTYAKKDTLHTKRMALQILRTKDAFVKLFSEYKEQFANRSGGYTRIIKLGTRQGDNAPMAYIEYVKDEIAEKTSTGRKRRRRKKTTTTTESAKILDVQSSDTQSDSTVEASAETKNPTEDSASSNAEETKNKEEVQEDSKDND